MASFFQPLRSSGDPVITACNTNNSSDGSLEGRLVYCNKLIPLSERLRTPLQRCNLAISLLCMALPLIVWSIGAGRGLWRGWRSRPRNSGSQPPKTNLGLRHVQPQSLCHFASIKSFQFLSKGVKVSRINENPATLLMAPLPSFSDPDCERDPIFLTTSNQDRLLGILDTSALSATSLPVWENFLFNLVHRENIVSGVVLRVGGVEGNEEKATDIVGLTRRLACSNIPVVLCCHHDDDKLFERVEFPDLSGVIIREACLLGNGARRCYFRSQGLRRVMKKCAEQRNLRPDFFVGFYDRWATQPSAAVLCRAAKVAKHFGAIFEHGPSTAGKEMETGCRSISGFEFLRKPETCELQQIWLKQERKVRPNSDAGISPGSIAYLDLDSLERFFPNLKVLLSPVSNTPESSDDIADSSRPPLKYSDSAPARFDFWESSPNGEQISTLGCLPVTCAATSDHYQAVLQSQIQLQELNMLQRVNEAEVETVLEGLRLLHEISSQFYLLKLLIDGLKQQKIVVYRGLGTGFMIPDTQVEFWGVSSSNATDASLVSIFISRRSPCDSSTILHTWLAHHGVSRIHRYEEEVRLDCRTGGPDLVELPCSIRRAIDAATPFETLSLLLQLQIAQPQHSFRRAMQEYCSRNLIDDVSAASWNDMHSRQFLDGSISIQHLLQRRLSDLQHMGLKDLPPLSSLARLYVSIEEFVGDTLFRGDSGAMSTVLGALSSVYDLAVSGGANSGGVDINADLFTTMFFCALRRAAMDDVYLEATDRCPIFSRPDQAAVFAELWVLGSQCELYFGIASRVLGEIIYNKHRVSLRACSLPTGLVDSSSGIMTVFAKPEPMVKGPRKARDSSPWSVQVLRRLVDFGALSVFCLPAMLDIILLTFVGRGLFMTAYMGDAYLVAACYALLASMLLGAGITGWIGSVGNYYLSHYAYISMVHFHVQRLSGSFVLSILVGFVGALVFHFKNSPGSALVFFAYFMLTSTYLSLLGILATMHQQGSPLTSGRTVLWRTLPVLFIAPLISSFLNHYDLILYLSFGYFFLFLLLLQYRRLCHEWMNWIDNIPTLTETGILDWYHSRMEKDIVSDDTTESSVIVDNEESTLNPKQVALQAFRESVLSYQQGLHSIRDVVLCPDPLVRRVVLGLPFIDWLVRKHSSNGESRDTIEPFSVSWFAQLDQALKAQKQMTQGLKEHSIFMLSRYSKLDIGQNVGLFLICLMDRWVSIATAATTPPIDVFFSFTSRYAICLAILYFCVSIMALDVTLRGYWQSGYELPEQELTTLEDAALIACNWERSRRHTYFLALRKLCSRLMLSFGVSSLFVWALVDDNTMIGLYYLYAMSYSAIIIFQFNRCFTTNASSHTASILFSAATGFVVGCVLHGASRKSPTIFTDAISLSVSATTAAILTTIWVLGGNTTVPSSQHRQSRPNPKVWVQHCLVEGADGTTDFGSLEIRGEQLIGAQNDPLVRQITEIFRVVERMSASSTDDFGGVKSAAQIALTMWERNTIQVEISSRSLFLDNGLSEVRSFSRFQGENFQIIVQGFGFSHSSSRLINAEIVAESILYHICAAVQGRDPEYAVRASLSVYQMDLDRRLRFESAARGIPADRAWANSALLKRLCLSIDIDRKWDQLPQYVREAIFSRVAEKPVMLSPTLRDWMQSNDRSLDLSDFHARLVLSLYRTSEEFPARFRKRVYNADSTVPVQHSYIQTAARAQRNQLGIFAASCLQFPSEFAKWIGIISGGSSNIERELWHKLSGCPAMRAAVIWLALLTWGICRHVKSAWIYAILIYHHRALVHISRLAKKGTSRTLQKNRIVVQLRRSTMTGFASLSEEGSLVLDVFEGRVQDRPKTAKAVASATYDEAYRLVRRYDESLNGQITSVYSYRDTERVIFPMQKNVRCGDMQSLCQYDKKGRVTHGIISFGTIRYSFRYWYKKGTKQSGEVLKADFIRLVSGTTQSLEVYWGAPTTEKSLERLDWVPSDRVHRIIKTFGNRQYTMHYDYLHRRDPKITTYLHEGGTSAAVPWSPPPFEHEHQLQQRPKDNLFGNDDLLSYHRHCDIKYVARCLERGRSWGVLIDPACWQYWRKKTVYRPVPTWWLRTELWSHWRQSGRLDALAACWLDEIILREEPHLREYWRARGSGRLDLARSVLDARIQQISAAIELDKEVSEVCMLPIKTSDLYAMGLGRDANQMTLRPQDCFHDENDRISVIFNDLGCWPDSPGGVSNCRRDLVDGHRTIRNHVLAESANDFGIPRFQVERSIQSLKLLPLWGLDGRNPNHGLIDNLLESEVDEKIANTDSFHDIGGTFVPLLGLFVKGARSRSLSRKDIETYTGVILAMFDYFERKDYNKTWNSKEVADSWVHAWLTPYDDPNIVNAAEYFEMEKPSLADFRSALAIYSSYFFIFSVQTPEDCPKVFQSTHHGISSLFGVHLKHRRGTTFGIWDHAILWRECCLNLSPAQSELPLPVQSMVLSGIGLAMRLAYFHADVVLPCTSVFNPIWEVELGTDSSRLGHKKLFGRKIDPIVNGVSNMDAFKPVETIRSDKPTVVMLSNVQFIKDIKTAILAADVIVNKYGFTDYQLFVYGARDREPNYDVDMARLIESCKLGDHVVLKGFGKPQDALQDAWLFMNSSLSEGLPLAIAEAALAGVPIVATAVGATALVLTDPDSPTVRYGEVVPPNDPTALARAQVAMLAMAGPWAKFTGEVDVRGSVAPHLAMPDNLSTRDVEWLTKRMYDKTEDRRKLGMLGREMVLRGFHGERYLREHEQMYWVQWQMARMRKVFAVPQAEESDPESGASRAGEVGPNSTNTVLGGGWNRLSLCLRLLHRGKRLQKKNRDNAILKRDEEEAQDEQNR